MSQAGKPNELARLEQAANDRPRYSGFSEERGLAVREQSSVWAEVEEAQNVIWGITARTEARRQAWRDRMAAVLDTIERAVQPLTDHKQAMGVSDKDMKTRVLRHRSPAKAHDPQAEVPEVTLETGVIEFMDLGKVDIRPCGFNSIRMCWYGMIADPDTKRQLEQRFNFRDEDGAWVPVGGPVVPPGAPGNGLAEYFIAFVKTNVTKDMKLRLAK